MARGNKQSSESAPPPSRPPRPPPPPQAGGGGPPKNRTNTSRARAASSFADEPLQPNAESNSLLKASPHLTSRDPPKSSFADLFSLTDNDDVRFTFVLGTIFAFLNGLTTPALAHVIAYGLRDLAGAVDNPDAALPSAAIYAAEGDEDAMEGVRRTVYHFLGVGVYAFVCSMMQNACMEVAAARTERRFLTRWFGALLKQDAAFYDVYDPSVLAPTVTPSSRKVRLGLGRKLGEGVQFLTAFAGGLAYALLSSWKTALVLLGTIPIVVLAVFGAYRFDRDRPRKTAEAYASSGAAGVARNAISAMRTVLARNAGKEMERRYKAGVDETYRQNSKRLWLDGVVVGTALASFLLLFCVFTLFGSWLVYSEIERTGCDPSGSIAGATPCTSSGTAVLGALLGVAFAAQGLAQLPPVHDAIQEARVGCYPGMIAMRRCEGAEAEEVVVTLPKNKKKMGSVRRLIDDGEAGDLEAQAAAVGGGGEGSSFRVKAILPRFTIDSSSTGGMRLKGGMSGALHFRSVSFAYPTRPNRPILDDFSLSVPAGSTVAIVGNKGCGRSTVVSLLKRFYDPTFGAVAIDGVDLRDFNVHYLRSKVRSVEAEPVVFETSVAANIQLGRPNATRKEIKRAAEMAGIHDFVMALPDAYNSVIGDWGVQLTAAQMQRIALARALISHPKVLIFDKATSALDSKSAEDLQDTIDDLAARGGRDLRTTVVIPTRLSTIWHVDTIVVLDERGRAVEIGTHDELMSRAGADPVTGGYYRRLVERENSGPTANDSLFSLRSSLKKGAQPVNEGSFDSGIVTFRNVSFSYPARPHHMVMNRFSLSVRPGELLALVGPRGGGKLTALALAERFYDPAMGTVEFEGRDLREYDVIRLRERICFLQLDAPLLSTSIARNVDPTGRRSQRDIEQACGMAGVHGDILAVGGYGAEVRAGETSPSARQRSMSFRQRIAIANAFLRKPKVVLLDEATSAFDNELDATVQDALERLLTTEGRTAIVVAHRNATLRAADRIAFVLKGRVREIGTHAELMNKSGGKYKQLVDAQRGTREFFDVESHLRMEVSTRLEEEDEEEEDAMEVEEQVDEGEMRAYDYQRARRVALRDAPLLALGSFGSVAVGGLFPGWGLLFGYVISVLFQRVPPCATSSSGDSCSAVNESIAGDARDKSIQYGIYWIVIAVACLIFSTLTFWAFGLARERLNRRTRESSFAALMRQDVAYFDRRSTWKTTYLLEGDVARIHVFSGEPIRIIVTNLTSIVAGLAVACVTMWPLALVSLAFLPLSMAATNVEVSAFLGETETDNEDEGFDSPGGIVLETLLNIRTVSSLGIERQRYNDYRRALSRAEPNFACVGFLSGFISALPPLIQQSSNALIYWWGGWLLFYYGHLYTFQDLVISLFSLSSALLSLGASASGITNHKVCERSAGRVFYLLDRKSSIDPHPEKKEEGALAVDVEIS